MKRRHFLGVAGAGAGALLVVGPALPVAAPAPVGLGLAAAAPLEAVATGGDVFWVAPAARPLSEGLLREAADWCLRQREAPTTVTVPLGARQIIPDGWVRDGAIIRPIRRRAVRRLTGWP